MTHDKPPSSQSGNSFSLLRLARAANLLEVTRGSCRNLVFVGGSFLHRFEGRVVYSWRADSV